MARVAAALLLAAVFGLNVYRAVTQSLTIDEAFCYQFFIGLQPFGLLNHFAANLHVLHTLASWASVQVFGLSEISLRLPSLVGCALYLIAVYRIAQRTTWWAVLLLVANPLIEDHMSVSRGYGLALAWFAWAFVEVMEEPIRLTRVAVFLALSIATNLTFLFPAAGLVAALMWQRRSILLDSVIGPSLVMTVLMIGVPLSYLQPGSLYVGAGTVSEGLDTLLGYSVGSLNISPQAILLAGGFLLVSSTVAMVYFGKGRRGGLAFFATATFSVTAVGILMSHMLLGYPYPSGRTGLYLLFLGLLCLLPLARWKLGAAAIIALSLYMAVHIRADSYQEWSFDASTRDIVHRIMQRHHPGGPPVKIATVFPIGTTIQVYRTMYGLDWITDIKEAAWEPGFDYYVLGQADFPQMQVLGLHDTGWPVNPEVKVAVP